jgi:chemotaxis signal transduction protein
MSTPHDDSPAAQVDEGWRGLAFRLGADEVLVASHAIAEVLDQPEPLTRVAGVPQWIEGVAAIRGAITLIVNLPRLLGIADTGASRGRRLLLARVPDSPPVGLLVPEVLGPRQLDAAPTFAAAADEPESTPGLRTCTVSGGDTCSILDVPALLRGEAFRATQW